jgi:hypothetical protein
MFFYFRVKKQTNKQTNEQIELMNAKMPGYVNAPSNETDANLLRNAMTDGGTTEKINFFIL